MTAFKSGDFNLNRFSRAFGESAMRSFKQAILEQELTFKNQVRELHRLYWAQKALMKELQQKGVDVQVESASCRNETALFANQQRDFDLNNNNNNNNNNDLFGTDLSKANGKFDFEKSLISSVASGCNEIIDLEDSTDSDRHEKAEVRLKENNVCSVPSVVHFGEEQDGKLKDQMPHVACVETVESSLDSVYDHSKITHESKKPLFDLNMPAGVAEVHNSSQDSMLEENNRKNFNDFESKMDINVWSSVYPVGKSTDSSDRALSINEAPISSIELSKHDKGGVSPSDEHRLVAQTYQNWQESNFTSTYSIKLPQAASSDSTEKPSNHKESEEDEAEQNAFMRTSSVRYDANSMSDCSSYEKGEQETAAPSITDDSVITLSQITENERSYTGKFKPEEQDMKTTAAAQTLMDISFGGSDITTEKFDIIEDESDQIQVSSDSFEALTVELSEIRNDEIMVVMPRLNGREEEDLRTRPRRGKGLRNFQKEILPGLVSLSRHEICEDLYSINYEFRRNSFRISENIFVPVTSRRSRQCSGRR
ncbi:uncharacterized protein LOC110027087 [Phalaenopsis equestris]|uniref:uncharacterized protein LOC110027087 n=1 Tax=Phalaenopsis equestris TaxID=78828 RepID=UPI0009E43A99|nr:uncharacterized protein LOC110027087 [Phalaenopsis equestris]